MQRLTEPRLLVSLLVLTGALVVTLIVLFRDGTTNDMVGVIVGAWLSGGLVTLVNYWLGSSKGSTESGRAMRAMLRDEAAAPAKPSTMASRKRSCCGNLQRTVR